MAADRPIVWGSLSAEPPKTDAAPLIAGADPSVVAPLADAEPLVAVVTAPRVVTAPSDATHPAPMAGPRATAPTRRSRRAGQTGEQPIVAQVVVAAEPVVAVVAPPTPAAPLDTVLVAAEPFELLEPELSDAPHPSVDDVLAVDDAEPADCTDRAASAPTAAEIDAFEAAARLFSFTGETPVQFAVVDDESAAADSSSPDHVAPRRNRGASFKRVTAASFSFSVMGIVGLLTVGMTTPVAAVAAPGGTDITSSLVASPEGEASVDEGEIQAYVTPTEVQNATIERAENYSTVTMAQLASESGIINFSNFFVNDPNSA
ncbi:MAG: hypothetical protein ACXWZG_01905, partial [Microbacterium sp.]